MSTQKEDITLSPQAIITATLGGLGLLITVYMNRNNFTQQFFLIFLTTLIILSITVYEINCLSKGQCETWAWIRSLGPIILYFTGLFFMSSAQLKRFVRSRRLSYIPSS